MNGGSQLGENGVVFRYADWSLRERSEGMERVMGTELISGKHCLVLLFSIETR